MVGRIQRRTVSETRVAAPSSPNPSYATDHLNSQRYLRQWIDNVYDGSYSGALRPDVGDGRATRPPSPLLLN